MNFEQAMVVITRQQELMGAPGLLETLEYMQANLDDFDRDERIAFGVVFRSFQALFAPVD